MAGAAVANGEVGARQAAARVIATPGPTAATHDPPSAAPSPHGAPLDVATRASMGPRFAHDFSDVAIFSDRAAGVSALGLGADAYTHGRAIAFAPGRYDPKSDAGRALIAHELAHVVQQRSAPPRVQRQPAPQAQRFDAAYELYLNPQSTRYHRASGRYELSPWDLAHLVRRAGFYFQVVHEDVGHDGTAGCVGLQRRPDTLAVFARLTASTEQIPLAVRYPHGTAAPPPRR